MSELTYEYKEIDVPAAFTDDGRKKNLEKLKIKMAKNGWVLDSYFNGGLTKKSKATFRRDIDYKSDKKESSFSIKSFLILLVILAVIIALYSNGDTDGKSRDGEKLYQKYENMTNLQMRENAASLKKIAYSFVEDKNISNEYKDTFYDCLGYYIYKKNPNLKFKKMLQWCQNDYINKEGKAIYYNEAWLMEDFSGWDGSYRPLENIIKNNMHDDSSYEHVETRYRMVFSGTKRPYMLVSTVFRGKNAYGATVKQTITAKVDAKTKELFDVK